MREMKLRLQVLQAAMRLSWAAQRSLAIGQRGVIIMWGGVTAGKANHNARNARGVTAGKMGRNSSDFNCNWTMFVITVSLFWNVSLIK